MSPSPSTIHLQGTTLEGGGQLVRLALSLSSLTSIPISISNIRGNRRGSGGLKSQHLTCVHWLSAACNAALSGASLRSRHIIFTPDIERPWYTKLESGNIEIQQATPGSTSLILQAFLPFILFSGVSKPIRLHITGGTNVSNAPSYDYVAQVLLPMLHLIGIPRMTTDLHSRGWSQGSSSLGTATYTITPLPNQLPAFRLYHRGTITKIAATVIAPANTEQQFRQYLTALFERDESRFFDLMATSSSSPSPYSFDITFEDSRHEKRFYVLLVATASTGVKLGRDWLYDKAVRPGTIDAIIATMVERVGRDLISEIEHGGCVDAFLRDQLVVFQALATGKSVVCGGYNGIKERVEPSQHTKTAHWVAKEILGVNFDEGGGCEGVGFWPRGRLETGAKDEGVLVEQMGQLGISESHKGT